MEQFDDKEHLPLNLECGHSYCSQCVTSMMNVYDLKKCPECRHKISKSIKDLTPNLTILQILVNRRQQEKYKEQCPQHPDFFMDFQCQQCAVEICKRCLIAHSGHLVVPLNHSNSKIKREIEEKERTLDNITLKVELRILHNSEMLHRVINHQFLRQKYSNLTRQLGDETHISKLKIDRHTQSLNKFVEDYFQNLNAQRRQLGERVARIEAEADQKLKLVDQLTSQIKDEAEGVLVEERLAEIKELGAWADRQIETLESQKKADNIIQQISLDANLTVKNPTELQEIIFEDEEVLSTSIVFFGELSRIVGYRPDIDYWFTGKSNMELSESPKQFSYMHGLQASLVYHNKIIFTGTIC